MINMADEQRLNAFLNDCEAEKGQTKIKNGLLNENDSKLFV